VKGKKMREASAGQKEMLMQGKKPAKQALGDCCVVKVLY
jgi:hypothetical protein